MTTLYLTRSTSLDWNKKLSDFYFNLRTLVHLKELMFTLVSTAYTSRASHGQTLTQINIILTQPSKQK